MKKLSTEPYKGTRDFYPEDMVLQNYIRNTMSSVTKKYGYQEYAASVLEETDLYRAKSGEEIINEQTYSFVDRGGREVTLRPEMTPTVARMISNKRRELSLPVRWYSIPNCFRYEKPQRGRIREFWQLNIDLLGDESPYADAEIIKVASDIMCTFGADPEKFVIRVNNRALMNKFFLEVLGLDEQSAYRLSKLIDKKDKISQNDFEKESRQLVKEKFDLLGAFITADTIDSLPSEINSSEESNTVRTIMRILTKSGVTNCIFDPTLMRGFDYYTGMVFEVFDTGPENRRSLFGGGRFDKLVDLFGAEPISAVGFGMGDLPIEGYLETYNLIPKLQGTLDVQICGADQVSVEDQLKLAGELRSKGVSVAVDFGDKKLDKKIKNARKSGARYFIVCGEREYALDSFVLEEIATGIKTTVSRKDLIRQVVEN